MKDLEIIPEGSSVLPILKNPGHLVRRLHQIAVSLFLAETGDLGLTPVQYSALIAVQTFPGIDQRSLARAIAFDRSTICDVVARLETKGLLERGGGRDKRTKSMWITAEGKAILERMQEPIERFEHTLLKPLSEGERLIFAYLLGKLVNVNNELSRVPLAIGRRTED